jgi:hypothetical protein
LRRVPQSQGKVAPGDFALFVGQSGVYVHYDIRCGITADKDIPHIASANLGGVRLSERA